MLNFAKCDFSSFVGGNLLLFSAFESTPPPMPSDGTDTPAFPSLFIAPWFNRVGGSAASSYAGGGDGDRLGIFLAGNRGGREGFGLGTGPELYESSFDVSFRRAGGGGRCEVDSPVVSERYGTGGGAGLECSGSSTDCVPEYCRAGGAGAIPPVFARRGGGPNDAGSFRLDIGRETRSVAPLSLPSFPFPIHPATWLIPLKSPRQLSLPPSLPLGCHPSFRMPFMPLIVAGGQTRSTLEKSTAAAIKK